MSEKLLGEWKKAYENDLSYVVQEMKGLIETPGVIILDGVMGSGKTTLTRHFSEGKLDSSPSYSVINEVGEYVHADFYRVEKSEEIIHLELSQYLDDKNYVLFEWGMKFFYPLLREIPEGFNIYIARIEINEPSLNKEMPSRNFSLSVWREDL